MGLFRRNRTQILQFIRHHIALKLISKKWHRPFFGYLAAIIMQVIMLLLAALLIKIFPSYQFLEGLTILVVLGITLVWGAGPSFLATGAGGIMLLLHRFYISTLHTGNIAALSIYILAGIAIGQVLGNERQKRRYAISALREVENRQNYLNDLFMQAPSYIALVKGPEHRVMLANPLFLQRSGCPTLVGKNLRDAQPEQIEQSYISLLDEVYRSGVPFVGNEVPMRIGGQHNDTAGDSYFNFMCQPTYAVDGTIDGILLHGFEVTEQVQARKHIEELAQQLEGEREQLQSALSREQALRGEAESVTAQLEAIIEAVPDAIYVIDQDGKSVRMNTAGRGILAFDSHSTTSWKGERLGMHIKVRNEYGQPLVQQQWPSSRILRGEVLSAENAAEVTLRRLDGRDIAVSMTGGLVRDSEQNVIGAVTVVRDVTGRRMLERRMQETLESLLVLAGELVHLPNRATSDLPEHMTSARYLAALIRSVLDCKRVTITSIDPETGALLSMAAAGMDAEQERCWQERRPGFSLGEQLHDTAISEQLNRGEIVVVDMSQAPWSDLPNPFGATTVLFAPMVIETRLIGILTVDHEGAQHSYTPYDIALTRAVSELTTLIMEREHLLVERAAAHANELALRETNRQMDEFIGIAGHELRTPLTTVKTSVQLAKRQLSRLMKKDETQLEKMDETLIAVQSFLERAERQIGMQNRLISDLLDVSRIQTNHLELHPALCDLAALVAEVIEDQRYLTPLRTLHLTRGTIGELLVLADVDRLRQVVTNYLSNALKYSDADKPVDIYVEAVGQKVRVSVRDQGPGLSAAEQLRVWERFYRAPGIEVKSGSGIGLGLGLHISRMIVERQGGQVGIQSNPGSGATFWFMLPRLKH